MLAASTLDCGGGRIACRAVWRARLHRHRRTIALALLAVVAGALIAVAAAKISGREEPPAVSGDAKDVVATVMQFQTALANRDWAGICARLYSSRARAGAGGGRCAANLAQSAGTLRDPRVTIVSVVVRGEAATVTVSASVNGKPPVRDAIELVREGGHFRIASSGVG
jgi:hypothetical protein